MRHFILSAAMMAACLPVIHANANDTTKIVDQSFEVLGSVGYTWLRGNELVYENGNRISHLIWETGAPLLQLSARAKLGDDWTVSARASTAFAGTSHMADYDWLLPHRIDFAFDNWTDRSLHPNTLLDRYLELDVALGRDFALDGNASINVHGGFRYTNVKWTAYGGSFVYSDLGFRDDVGGFSPSQIISYEQRFPGLYLGASGTLDIGDWTLAGHANAGLTISATATDHHWRRNLRFEEVYAPKPFVEVGAQADYKVSDTASVYLAGSYEHHFNTRGDVMMYDIPTGAYISGPDIAGAASDLTTFRVAGGIKVQF